MAHHKRHRPRNRRGGCKLCKPWKINGFRTERSDGEKFSDHRRRVMADAQVREPNETYTATGWHYELTALLRQFGYRPVGRYEAYELAQQLLELGYDR